MMKHYESLFPSAFDNKIESYSEPFFGGGANGVRGWPIRGLGGGGDLVDHDSGLERDRFDPYFDHILLFDDARRNNPIIGVYRVMTCEKAFELGEFYRL